MPMPKMHTKNHKGSILLPLSESGFFDKKLIQNAAVKKRKGKRIPMLSIVSIVGKNDASVPLHAWAPISLLSDSEKCR